MKCSATRKILSSLFLWVSLGAKIFAEEQPGEMALYRFSDNWLRYDKYYETYLPLKNDELKGSKSIHQILNFDKFRNHELQFMAEKGLALFVNNKLVYKKIKGEEEKVRILLSSFESTENGEIVLTFFHPEGILPFYSAAIVNSTVSIAEEKDKTESGTLLMARIIDNKLSAYLFLFMSILTLFVMFKQIYPKEYVRFFSLTSQENADHLLPGSFSIPSLWMTLINGLSISLLINMLGLTELIFTASYSFIKSIFLITAGYFTFYIGKYLYLWIVAWLFNYSKIVSPQFSEYIRFFEKVCLCFSLIVFGLIASGFITVHIKPEILYFSLIMVLVFCVMKVIFLFFRLISPRNLYLFSYLCAAEILPLIIAIKILLF